MTDEWGPWIEHDGSGCPIKRGQTAEVVWADGTSWSGKNKGQSAEDEGILEPRTDYCGPRYASSWVWDRPGTLIPVIRYRIRKPRALQQLIEIAENVPAEGVPA